MTEPGLGRGGSALLCSPKTDGCGLWYNNSVSHPILSFVFWKNRLYVISASDFWITVSVLSLLSKPLQYSCLRNPVDRSCLQGYSPWGRRVRHDGARPHAQTWSWYRSVWVSANPQQQSHRLLWLQAIFGQSSFAPRLRCMCVRTSWPGSTPLSLTMRSSGTSQCAWRTAPVWRSSE